MNIESHTEVKINGSWCHYSARNPKIIDIIELIVPIPMLEHRCITRSVRKEQVGDISHMTLFALRQFDGVEKYIGVLSSEQMATLQDLWRLTHKNREWELTEEFGFVFGNDYDPPARKHLEDFPVGFEDFRIIYWVH